MAYDNTLITDIMKDIGCGDGFHIPVANEENQLLENEVGTLSNYNIPSSYYLQLITNFNIYSIMRII